MYESDLTISLAGTCIIKVDFFLFQNVRIGMYKVQVF